MPSMTETIVKDPQPHERYHRGLARSAHCAAVAIVRRRRPRESAMAPDPDPTRENATSNASWLGVERGCSSVEVNAGRGRLGGSAASATRAPHAATAGGRAMRQRQGRREAHAQITPRGPRCAALCTRHAGRITRSVSPTRTAFLVSLRRFLNSRAHIAGFRGGHRAVVALFSSG